MIVWRTIHILAKFYLVNIWRKKIKINNMKKLCIILKAFLLVFMFIASVKNGLFSWVENVHIIGRPKSGAFTEIHGNTDITGAYRESLDGTQTLLSASIVENKPSKLHHNSDTAVCGFDVRNVKLEFLPEFKNPCWLEPYTNHTVYQNNPLFSKESVKPLRSSVLKHLSQVAYQKAELCGRTGMCRLRCLPYFMLIGVHKSGSTDLYQRMSQHPRIFSSIRKEIYWWNQFRFMEMSGASLGNYADTFDPGTARLKYHANKSIDTENLYYPSVLGEYTAMTFFDMSYWRQDPMNFDLSEPLVTTPFDVHKINPNMKLLVILRNPSTRLYSHYNFFARNPNPQDFHKKVLGSIWWWKTCTESKALPRRNCAYGSPPDMPYVYDKLGSPKMWWNPRSNYSGELRTSMYSIHAKEWLDIFPRDNMLFIKTEEYSFKITKSLRGIFQFLGLDQIGQKAMQKVIKKRKALKQSYKPMLNDTQIILEEFYKPFNQELAALLEDEKWLWES